MNKRTLKKYLSCIVIDVALAVSVLICVVSCYWVFPQDEPDKGEKRYYQTNGKELHVILPDGSTAKLNVDTVMHFEQDINSRRITIQHGSAYFNVVDDDRPFRVSGGTGQVMAPTRSAFEVQVNGEKMTVSVKQGRMAVSPQSNIAVRRNIRALQKITVFKGGLGDVTEVPATHY